MSERVGKDSCGWGVDGVRCGHPDLPEVLGLEPVRATAHLHAVGTNEQVRDIRQQQPSQHFQVPFVGYDVVQVVVGVKPARVQHGVSRRLEVGE